MVISPVNYTDLLQRKNGLTSSLPWFRLSKCALNAVKLEVNALASGTYTVRERRRCICKLNVSTSVEGNVSSYFNLCDGCYFAESKLSGLGLSSPGTDQVESAF